MTGVVLEILYHKIAHRPCDTCRKFLFDDGPEGTHDVVERIPGHPEPRGRMPTPCELDPKKGCPKGHWSRPQSLNERNRQAYQFHQMYRAAGIPVPADPIRLRNALLIQLAEDRCEEVRRQETNGLLRLAAITRRTM